MMDDLIDRVRKLDVADGDVLLVTTPRTLSNQTVDRIRWSLDGVMKSLAPNVTVLVLDDGMDLKVIRKCSPSDPVVDGSTAVAIDEG